MATGTRKCKVCGKEYPYCRTERRIDIFRWQDVACSPEHGSIYFSEIEAARNSKQEPDNDAVNETVISETPADGGEEPAAGKRATTKPSRKKQQ